MIHRSSSPHGTQPHVESDVRDRGSVLPMILALMVVGSLAVVALLTFATTLFTNRPPIEVRDRTFWSAKSAMSMAMVLQNAHGPAGCYKATDAFTLNGFTANVTCVPGASLSTGRGRYAVMTTANDATKKQLVGMGVGAIVKPVTGPVFVNGGVLDNSSRDLALSSTLTLSNYAASPLTPLARFGDYTTVPQPAAAGDCGSPVIQAQAAAALPSTGLTCVATPWWQLAGDDTGAGVRSYPNLPPLPPYERPSVAQARIPATGPNPCNIYFPGQYTAALTLGAGDHYFASGVYYFTQPVTLTAGARVVAGEGRYAGCSVDAEAAFASTAPRAHTITGKGATFVFGGAGKIVSTDASLRFNRRVSDASTRGSETVSIRSVNFNSSPPPAVAQPVEIPDDFVWVSETYTNPTSCDATISMTTCYRKAADYTSQVNTSAPVTRYTDSTLGIDDVIVEINQRNGTASTNQFVADGYVFVPNAKVKLDGSTNTNYRLRMTGGVVTSALDAGYISLPSGANDWFVGVLSEPIQLEVGLNAVVTAPSGQRTISRASLQVNVNRSYAIRGWTVDPNAQATTTTTTTTTLPPTTTTTTTLPPTTTSTTTTTTTTTTVPPTTTTVPSTSGAPCNTTTSGLTRNFGAGTWSAQYWNRSGFSGPPSNPFDGPPSVTMNLSQVFKNSTGSVESSVNADYFTARFSRTFNVGTACTVTFRVGGDDGYRFFVNGVLQPALSDWTTHGFNAKTAAVALPAGPNTVTFEFYEQTGTARYEVEWQS